MFVVFDVNACIALLFGSLWLLAPSAVVKTFGSPPPSAISSKDSSSSSPTRLSTEAQDFLARPVDRNAFAKGLSLIKNRNDSALSRRLGLDKMHGARRAMDAAQLRAFRDEAAAVAQNPQEPPDLSAQAISAMASANLLLLERGAISPEEARRDAPFLMKVAQDRGKDHRVRGRAVRALSDLRIAEAAPILQQILSDPANFDNPEIARNGCIALARLNPEKAQPLICNIMSQTREQAIFGSGAFALGQLKTPDAVAALVRLQGRFPDSGSCAGALSEMGEVILAVLKNPGAPQLIPAIQATRHLWKKSQREQFIPLLHKLLRTAPPAARAQAVERLLDATSAFDFAKENQELEAILGLITDQPDLDAYARRIRQRLSARPLVPTGQTIPVPPASQVN